MVACFGLRDGRQPPHFPADRIVEATLRLSIWSLLRAGALTEGVATELEWPTGASRVKRDGPNLWVGGIAVAIVWDEPMPGVSRPWFECPMCRRRARHLYFRNPLGCRRCHKLDYASRHLRRQTPGVGRVERLRRKLGNCDTRPFAPLPPSRAGRHRAYYEKLVAMIRAEEQALVDHLGSVAHDLERRIRVRKRRGEW